MHNKPQILQGLMENLPVKQRKKVNKMLLYLILVKWIKGGGEGVAGNVFY